MSMQPQISTTTLRDIAHVADHPGSHPAAHPSNPAGHAGHEAHAGDPHHAGSPHAAGEHAAHPHGAQPGLIGSHPTFVDRLMLIGLNHRRGDAYWLEKMAVPAAELPEVLAKLKLQPGIQQALVLSTCNRTELYIIVQPLAHPQAVFLAMDNVRSAWGDVPVEQLEIKKGWAAVEHLFAVASGLEAMILGETEITAQVKDAVDLAQKTQTAGPELVSLVQQALRATKKVRNNTRVHAGTFSIGSAAAQLALAIRQSSAPHAGDAPIAVIGAGIIGEQVVRALHRAGFHQFVVINRNVEKARLLVEKYSGSAAVSLDLLYPTLASTTVVIAAVSVAEPLVCAEHFESHARADQACTFIDLSVPRAIDHRLGDRPLRNLLGLPAVRKHLDDHIAQRTLDEPLARQILAEEVRRYRGRLMQQFLVPLIRTLQEQADGITHARLNRWTADHGPAPAVEKWANSLKGELLDMFLTAMRGAMVSSQCPLGKSDPEKDQDEENH